MTRAPKWSIQSKAQGVAYALRNASDYFQAKDGQIFSQRVLNLYYGSLSFAFAEMLAAPRGAKALSDNLCQINVDQSDGRHSFVFFWIESAPIKFAACGMLDLRSEPIEIL
jgi:hypothetical protein